MKKGFTLIETIVAIFVFSLLMVAVSGMIFVLYRSQSYQWEQSLAIEEAKRGVETMVKEIREAREGEDGSFPIFYAGDKEFIFFSDVDNDGKTERVRYFLGDIKKEVFSQECINYTKDGSCSFYFSNFLKGTLKEAKIKISVQGDLNSSSEYLTIYLDGQNFGNFCQSGCSQCPGNWQDTKTFDVLNLAQDGQISLLAVGSCPNPQSEPKCVDPICSPGNFSFKVGGELEITQEIQTTELKKGVIKATGTPPTYPLENEKVSVITAYVRNAPPIFEYFNEKGEKIEDFPARLINTKVMKVFLVVNVDPNRPPNEYQLQSFVQLRNLKKE
jgi:prepilin-type N-terminal cleavage/methylation domain-containing protein